MAKFRYVARERSGKLVEGVVFADSKAAAALQLQRQSLFVSKVSQQDWAQRQLIWRPRVTAQDLAVFCRLFAVMLEAGVTMNALLKIIIAQTDNRLLRTATQVVYDQVNQGASLSVSLATQPRIFPQLMVSLFEAGELSGTLDQVAVRLALQFEREQRLQEKVKSALVYPIVLLVVSSVMLLVVLVFVVPAFGLMFEQLQLELPLPTRGLLIFSWWLQEYCWLWLLGIMLIAVGVYWSRQISAGRIVYDAILLKLPVAGDLYRKAVIARFSRALSSLLQSGVTIVSAVEVVKRVSKNQVLVNAFTQAQVSIRQGSAIAEAFRQEGLFPPLMICLLAIGEDTGRLDQMLDKLADFYEQEVGEVAGRLSTLLEPVLIVGLGGVIGLAVLAVLLPLFDLISGVGL